MRFDNFSLVNSILYSYSILAPFLHCHMTLHSYVNSYMMHVILHSLCTLVCNNVRLLFNVIERCAALCFLYLVFSFILRRHGRF
jgi:hypothetical protein